MNELPTYKFRREDDGRIEEVSFIDMIQQDCAGYVTLDDGVKAKRIATTSATKCRDPANANHTPPVSDNLGFTSWQLQDFEEDRVRHGFTGVEFKADPACPQFYQVHCSDYASYSAYLKHRGKVNQGRTCASALSKDALLAAEEMARDRYPDNASTT